MTPKTILEMRREEYLETAQGYIRGEPDIGATLSDLELALRHIVDDDWMTEQEIAAKFGGDVAQLRAVVVDARRVAEHCEVILACIPESPGR